MRTTESNLDNLDKLDKIEVGAKIVNINEEGGELPPGKYLYVFYESVKENIKKETYIPFPEWSKKISKTRTMRNKIVERSELNVYSNSNSISQHGQQNVKQDVRYGKIDYTPLINFVLGRIGVDANTLNGKGEVKVIIRSSFQLFTELPWENVAPNSNIYVIREVPQDSSYINRSVIANSNNLLLLTSYARYLPNGLSLDQLDEDIKRETNNIIHSVVDRNEVRFRFNKVSLYKNTTKEEIKNINIKDFKYIHFIMHIIPSGICFSEDSMFRYRYIDNMPHDDFIHLLIRKLKKNKINMIFFSTCYSAGGQDSNKFDNVTNLAFKIVEKGISNYVIGCYDEAKSNLLPDISKFFYEKLIANNGDIEKSYINTLKKEKDRGLNGRCMLRLYKSIN